MANLRRWSSSASGNSSVAGGANTINFAEGQAPGSVNNSAREMMAQVRSIYTPAEWGWVEHSATASVASQTAFKLAGNQTSDWTAGRRWRLKSGSTTRYGSVVSSSFTAETTITVSVDSGSLSASHSLAALSPLDVTANPIPAIRFDTSGNVGIGGTPTNKFDVFGTVAQLNGNGAASLVLKDTSNTASAAFTVVQGKDVAGTSLWYVGKTDNTSALVLWNQISGGNISLLTTGGGNVLVPGSGGLGYGAGSGGTVTQLTSKATGVTLNKTNGQITMSNVTLTAATSVSFAMTNSTIAATDVVVIALSSGAANPALYNVTCQQVAASAAGIKVENVSGGALAEALVLNFAVIKAVTA